MDGTIQGCSALEIKQVPNLDTRIGRPIWLPTSGSNLGDRQDGNYSLHRSDSTMTRNIQQLTLAGLSSQHFNQRKKKKPKTLKVFTSNY
jgi:hypothetical protein